MLSSGICQVKILRKNLDLGLTVVCMSYDKFYSREKQDFFY